MSCRSSPAEGPQVPDPRAPAWQQHHAEFQVWWQHAYAAALARGDALVTTTPEHGPPPYCWVLPNGEPIADMWAVNAFVGDACKHTFDECVAADVSASLAAVHRAFPGAQDQAFVVPRVNAMLAAHGFTPANTLFAHSVVRRVVCCAVLWCSVVMFEGVCCKAIVTIILSLTLSAYLHGNIFFFF